ncbi:MAG: polyhydroxyalkanoic acid system family protein [Bacteroidetes bacterium]|nr:polyhydroxyalkanoic acid system family protein [Bacteroidota bacterium]
MTIQIEHTLSKEEARNRIEQLIERYKNEYKTDLQELVVDWAGDRAHIRVKAKGYGTSGNLEVRDGAVELDFYVPFMLQVFSKKIKSAVSEEIKRSLV